MTRFLRFLRSGAYLTFTALCSVYFLAALAGGGPLPGALAVAAGAFAGYAVSGFLSGHRALVSFAALAALAAGAVLLLPYGGWNVGMAVLSAACLLTGARHDWNNPEVEPIDVRLLSAGLTASLTTYLLAVLNGMDAVKAPIGYTTYAYLSVSILLVNRKSVRVNGGGQARRMMRGNQILSWAFVAAMTGVVFFGRLQSAVAGGLKWLVAAFFGLFSQAGGQGEQMPSQGPAGEMDWSALGGQENSWPPWVQAVTTALLYTVAAVVLLALAAFVAWSLWQAVKSLRAWLQEWLKRFEPGGAEEYAEESEQMLSAQSMGRQMLDEWKKRVRGALKRPVRWSALTPRERVRRVYAQLLRREAHAAPGCACLTPAQLCARLGKAQEFAALYGRARYSDEEIDAGEAEKYREYLKE